MTLGAPASCARHIVKPALHQCSWRIAGERAGRSPVPHRPGARRGRLRCPCLPSSSICSGHGRHAAWPGALPAPSDIEAHRNRLRVAIARHAPVAYHAQLLERKTPPLDERRTKVTRALSSADGHAGKQDDKKNRISRTQSCVTLTDKDLRAKRTFRRTNDMDTMQLDRTVMGSSGRQSAAGQQRTAGHGSPFSVARERSPPRCR